MGAHSMRGLLWLQLAVLCSARPQGTLLPLVGRALDGPGELGQAERRVALFGGSRRELQDEAGRLRRLHACNGTEEATEEDDGTAAAEEQGSAVLRMIIGTLTVMGGTRIQPVILLINGFVAAEVGAAFTAALEDFDPDKIVSLCLRVLSGLSVGVVGIQNMQFQSVLQGGVLFASTLQLARSQVDTWVGELAGQLGEAAEEEGAPAPGPDPCSTDAAPSSARPRSLKRWLILALDLAVTFLGSSLSVSFKALFKVLNSAYLSATMCVFGWVAFVKLYVEADVPGWLETSLVVLVLLFCLWWHSLILSKAREDEWKATFERQQRFKIRSRLQWLLDNSAVPIAVLNKLVTAVSLILGRSFNLKAAPATMAQIIEEVTGKLDIGSITLLVLRWIVTWKCIRMVRRDLKDRFCEEEEERRKAVQLTRQVCSALDVVSMRTLLVRLRTTGDITGVLDECFEEVLFGLSQDALHRGTKIDEGEYCVLWDKAKQAILDDLCAQVQASTKKVVFRCCALKSEAQRALVGGLVDQLDLQEMMTIGHLTATGSFNLEDLFALVEAKLQRAADRLEEAAAAKIEDVDSAPAATATVSMTVQNVVYSELVADATLLAEFEASVKAPIAEAAGVGLGDVDLELTPGSVRIRATIRYPAGADVATLQAQLQGQAASLPAAVSTQLSAIPGIAAVTSGSITVSDADVATIDPATEQQPPPQTPPGELPPAQLSTEGKSHAASISVPLFAIPIIFICICANVGVWTMYCRTQRKHRKQGLERGMSRSRSLERKSLAEHRADPPSEDTEADAPSVIVGRPGIFSEGPEWMDCGPSASMVPHSPSKTAPSLRSGTRSPASTRSQRSQARSQRSGAHLAASQAFGVGTTYVVRAEPDEERGFSEVDLVFPEQEEDLYQSEATSQANEEERGLSEIDVAFSEQDAMPYLTFPEHEWDDGDGILDDPTVRRSV